MHNEVLFVNPGSAGVLLNGSAAHCITGLATKPYICCNRNACVHMSQTSTSALAYACLYNCSSQCYAHATFNLIVPGVSPADAEGMYKNRVAPDADFSLPMRKNAPYCASMRQYAH